MNITFASKIEVTDDINIVNNLLEHGWFLYDVLATYKKNFLFLLLFYDENHYPGSDGLEKSK